MSGWLTPKLECNKKLQAIPCARLRQEAGRDRTPGFKPSPTGGTNQGPAYYQECVSLFGKKVFMKPVNE